MIGKDGKTQTVYIFISEVYGWRWLTSFSYLITLVSHIGIPQTISLSGKLLTLLFGHDISIHFLCQFQSFLLMYHHFSCRQINIHECHFLQTTWVRKWKYAIIFSCASSSRTAKFRDSLTLNEISIFSATIIGWILTQLWEIVHQLCSTLFNFVLLCSTFVKICQYFYKFFKYVKKTEKLSWKITSTKFVHSCAKLNKVEQS